MTTRVFVIDDDRDHAESISDVLMMHGYDVELAFSGEAALKRYRETDFDIVFMDVKLPGMNGVETFFEFKKLRPNTKVMLMTGYSLEQLIATAVENGALGVLHKPFAIGDLLDVLQRVKPRGVVLVADDDPEFAASIEPILSQHGYRVRIARTGDDALVQAAADGVNCLVLDLRMPVLSGLEVFLKLRQDGHAIPTIFVTGFHNEESAARDQLQRPFDRGILLKPFDPAELLRAIDAATGTTEIPRAATG
jgi:two-component system, NtrC family, response regulator HydG